MAPRKGEALMLRIGIENEVVEVVGRMHGLAKEVGLHDADLAKQLRRAASSIGLNAAEGLHAQKGHRTTRLETAMCSGREVIMALKIAGAVGHLDAETVADAADEVDRVVAILYKLSYRY